jgi:hypothetical protein
VGAGRLRKEPSVSLTGKSATAHVALKDVRVGSAVQAGFAIRSLDSQRSSGERVEVRSLNVNCGRHSREVVGTGWI